MSDTTTTTINVTPGKDEQANIVAFFARAILSDVPSRRREADADLIASVIDLAFTLGANARLDPNGGVQPASAVREAREALIARVERAI